MAVVKISELPAMQTIAGSDLLPIVDTSETETKKVTKQMLLTDINAEEVKIGQLTEASQINDEDYLIINQSGTNKKISKANAKFASGDEVAVQTTEPTGEDADSVKVWINPEETPSGSLNPITNEYSVAQDKGYSCNYVNNKLIDRYLINEVKTNKIWADGKPIYRKVISFSTSPTINSWDYIQHQIQNMDKPMPTCSMMVMYNGSWYYCPNDLIIEMYINTTNLSYYNNSSALADKPAFAVIEYTKTTD